MKLQLDYIDVSDVKFGQQTCIKDRVLYINKAEAEQFILRDPVIASVAIHIFYPGDMVRIINLQDIVQPRCKIEPEHTDFPGYLSRIQTAGSGHTLAIRGTAVAITNPDTNRGYSSFLDMAGPTAKLSRYNSMPIICLEPRKPDSIECDEFDFHMKRAVLNMGVYLAKAGIGAPVNETVMRDLDFSNLPRDPKLPRIAYYFLMYTPQHDHQGKSELFFTVQKSGISCPP